jgi:hypothetical protein
MSSRNTRAMVASFIAGSICFGAGAALSQSTSFPISLISFTGNTPAVASQVNANFLSLKNALDYTKARVEEKIGSFQYTGAIMKATDINGTLYVSGTSTLGSTNIRGNANVTGPLNVLGPSSLEGDTTVTGNLVVTGEVRDTSRYTLELAWNPAANASAANITNAVAPVNMDRLTALCSDADGCMLRLVMKDYAGSKSDASVGPLHFEYDASGAFRTADTGLGAGVFHTGSQTDSTFADGNGATQHAMRAWNCYFTDTNYTVGGGVTGSDTPRSMFLLSYNTEPVYKPRCLLIVDD